MRGSAERRADRLIARYLPHLVRLASETPPGLELPNNVSSWLDAVLQNPSQSYRDGLLWLLALAEVDQAPRDYTHRPEGSRTGAARLGQVLLSLHISATKDAFQNIGKNSTSLARGNLPAFDDLLRWMSGSATKDQIHDALRMVAWRTARTARSVVPMPAIRRRALTYARTSRLYVGLLSLPSGGAYAQLGVASLLEGLERQNGQGRRVETKNLNASDVSSRKAGDVQLLSGGVTLDAFEVTERPWATRLADAQSAIREYDLERYHIVAPVEKEIDVERALALMVEDVSVLDLPSLLKSLVALLRREFRQAAVERMYDLLDRLQPDAGVVNRFVRALHDEGLVETTL